MARLPSLNKQMHDRMEKMKTIGESKHLAKQEYKQYCLENNIKWNPSKTIGIHSFKTYEAYKQTSKEFVSYLRENHKEIKDINNIERTHVIEYLQHRQNNEMSAYTVSKDMSALNKLFNLDVNKKEADLRHRTYKKVTRSRTEKAHDTKYNPENYKDQITFAKASGCRRESVLKVTPQDFRRNNNGEVVSVFLKEKGGREREAPILKSYRQEIKSIIENKRMDQLIFDRYTSKIDNHAFRSEYAQKRYEEIVQEKGHEESDYRGFDREVIKQVSQNLGHNRESVVVEHYLR